MKTPLPLLRRGRGAQRRGGGGDCRNTDTGLAFPGLIEPPRRGLWLRLPLLIQGGEPSRGVSRQKLALLFNTFFHAGTAVVSGDIVPVS
jgi:hypothetical protein